MTKLKLLSDDHFRVDGTLIQAWASQKSFRPKNEKEDDEPGPGRNTEPDFRGEKRDTPASRTDPEARNYKKSKGTEATMAHPGHTVMENRNGIIVKVQASQADGYAG